MLRKQRRKEMIWGLLDCLKCKKTEYKSWGEGGTGNGSRGTGVGNPHFRILRFSPKSLPAHSINPSKTQYTKHLPNFRRIPNTDLLAWAQAKMQNRTGTKDRPQLTTPWCHMVRATYPPRLSCNLCPVPFYQVIHRCLRHPSGCILTRHKLSCALLLIVDQDRDPQCPGGAIRWPLGCLGGAERLSSYNFTLIALVLR